MSLFRCLATIPVRNRHTCHSKGNCVLYAFQKLLQPHSPPKTKPPPHGAPAPPNITTWQLVDSDSFTGRCAAVEAAVLAHTHCSFLHRENRMDGDCRPRAPGGFHHPAQATPNRAPAAPRLPRGTTLISNCGALWRRWRFSPTPYYLLPPTCFCGRISARLSHAPVDSGAGFRFTKPWPNFLPPPSSFLLFCIIVPPWTTITKTNFVCNSSGVRPM